MSDARFNSFLNAMYQHFIDPDSFIADRMVFFLKDRFDVLLQDPRCTPALLEHQSNASAILKLLTEWAEDTTLMAPSQVAAQELVEYLD